MANIDKGEQWPNPIIAFNRNSVSEIVKNSGCKVGWKVMSARAILCDIPVCPVKAETLLRPYSPCHPGSHSQPKLEIFRQATHL